MLVLLLGGILVIRGEMTAGMLVAFTSLLAAFIEPVSALVGFVRQIQTLKADMSRVEDIMRYEQDDKFSEEHPKVEMAQKLSGEIELQCVHRQPEHHAVFRHDTGQSDHVEPQYPRGRYGA